MSLNQTPKGERLHIALFGRRNAGKSSLINAITGQEFAIVSDVKGTTTDPVYKAMELLPLGPIMLIDTPGLDDEGSLGKKRIEKAKEVLAKTDIALIVADGAQAKQDFSLETSLLKETEKRKIPTLIILNKQDEWNFDEKDMDDLGNICVSTKTGYHIHELKELIAKTKPTEENQRKLVSDLIAPGDFVVLVVPIDESAPKGRLILPQQQVIRDVLECGAISVVCKDTELKETLARLGTNPALVITDSQAFSGVSQDTPANIPLTSFSILFSRYKGDLNTQIEGIKALQNLKEGDTILMAEGCTHHRQCNDIGTVKLPNWIREYTKKELVFETSNGGGFPSDLSKYAMVVHCGGCTLNPKEMANRIALAKEQQTPIVNYGTLIAELKGVLKRSIEPLNGKY